MSSAAITYTNCSTPFRPAPYYSRTATSSPESTYGGSPSSPSGSAASSSSSSSRADRNRITMACTYCRFRRASFHFILNKIKCDGNETCANCIRTKRECCYTEVSEDDNKVVRERKAHLRALKIRALVNQKAKTSEHSYPILGWSPSTPSSPSYSPPSASLQRPFPSVLTATPLEITYTPPHLPSFPLTTSSSGFSAFVSQDSWKPQEFSACVGPVSTPERIAYICPPPNPVGLSFDLAEDAELPGSAAHYEESAQVQQEGDWIVYQGWGTA